jgi:hypothetical protein
MRIEHVNPTSLHGNPALTQLVTVEGAHNLVDWAHAYYGTKYDHLARVKAGYDPGGFFRFHQSLPSQSPGRGTPP